MNRRDALKIIGGVVIPTIGVAAATGEDNIAQAHAIREDALRRHNSLPVAQYRREIEEDTWYKRSLKDPVARKPVVCQRIIRELINADEIMGGEWKLVSGNGTQDTIGRNVTYLRRSGRAWINREDAEHLLHTTNLTPIKVWGEVEMSEMVVLSIGAFKQQGFFTKTRTVGMTDKTQWEERK
jgi:hypothetical protein